MRAHQLDAAGVILNTIIVDSLDVLPDLVDASIGGSIGDSIIDGVLIQKKVVPSTPTIPDTVDRLQARLALLNVGKWNLIQPAIDAMLDPQKSIAQAYFEDAKYWKRGDTFVVLLAPAIGLSDSDVDALFIAAKAM